MAPVKPIEIRGRTVAGGAQPLICTPLVGRTRGAVLDELAAVMPKKPDLIEWRIDFFEAIADTGLVIDLARALKAGAGDAPILLTCRSSREGGERIPLADTGVVALLEAACAAGCIDLIDYELSNAAPDLRRLRAVSREHGVAMIMSYHNFQSTPDAAALVAKFTAAAGEGADIAKVAVMPRGPRDVLTLLEATLTASETLQIPLISMSMGAVGSLSRMFGWVYGSAVTFAVGKASSAPGQIPIDELRAVLAQVRRAVTGG
jgi:3-dehydroquinate dehydratase I